MNMVIRRTLFVLMCLLASSLYMYGQIAVKTNVAMDAVAIPNLGVEVGFEQEADSGCAHVLQSMEI